MKQSRDLKKSGFTLIELIVTTALAVAIGGATSSGIESTKYWLEPKRLSSTIHSIRSIAVVNRQFVTLCPSKDTYECEKNWQLPLIVFIDINNNKKRDISEAIIQTITPYTNITRSISYPRSQIRFNPQGEINGYTGTLEYCSKFNSTGIVLSRVGRIRYIFNINEQSDSDTPKICSKNT